MFLEAILVDLHVNGTLSTSVSVILRIWFCGFFVGVFVKLLFFGL